MSEHILTVSHLQGSIAGQRVVEDGLRAGMSNRAEVDQGAGHRGHGKAGPHDAVPTVQG